MSVPDTRLIMQGEPDVADPSLLREALAHVAPTTKEALFWYCLNVLRVPCESCGGTGSYSSSVGLTSCLRCKGEGRTGYRFARTAVCPTHTAPLDIFWELWVGDVKHKLIIGNRFGGKTLLLALLEYFKMKFQKFTVSHMGAVKQQALRAREHFHRIVSVPPGSEELEGFAVGEGDGEPGKEEARFRNGAVIEWLAGTLKQASGPHPELSVLDEVDEADPAVRQRFLKTPYGPRAQFVEASTHYIQQGTISLILKEHPHLSVAKFCLHGDSLIATPEGELPIRSLVGRRNVWVYTIQAGLLAMVKAKSIRLTRKNATVVRVRYSWGRGKSRREDSLVCTPDHRFLLMNGKWCEAKDLRRKDRLEPLYRRRIVGQNRGWVVGRSSQGMVNEHRFVYKQVFRRLNVGEVVHHRDGDHWNNTPKNLLVLTDQKHKSYHQRKFTRDPVREARRIERLRASRRESGSPWNVEVNRRRWANATPEQRKRWGRRISRALKGHSGWDTFRARRSPEERKVFFANRALAAVASRKRRIAEFGLTPAEVLGRTKAWQTIRRRYSVEAISRTKAAAARGESLRIARSNHHVLDVESAGVADVFCLSVPGAETFFANGVAVHNCLWESLENCTYDCDQMPLPDGTVGRCPLFETEEIQSDGSIRMATLCGGELARKSDGHIPVPSAVARWVSADMYSRRVEFLCEKPGMPIGGKAYWAYSPEIGTGNILPWNPEPRPDTPLMWTMDFNPGVGMRMCSFVIQQAPPEFGMEWWVLDEIVLHTSSTEETVRELLRRYGAGGHRLTEGARDTGHMGGLWVFGDAAGHTRNSVAGEPDYDAILRMLRNTHGFRLMVPYGSANPPLVDRLNLTNWMLQDLQGGGGKRWIKFAPRCVEGQREMELMPLGSDRKKDKSDKVQRRMGLSHLGDALEYWVEAMFPNGPTPSMLGALAMGTRVSAKDAYGQAVLGGRRSSGGGAGGGLPSPWTSSDRERVW